MESENYKQFVFVLGREQKIALAELLAVLKRFCFSFDVLRISGNLAFAKIKNFSETDAIKLMNALAGTIKIYEVVASLRRDLSAQLSELVVKEKTGAASKFNFGISNFNKNISTQQINSFAIKAKKSLKGRLSVRFVESRESAELSSILTLKNDLLVRGIEFGIFDDSIGVLVALNNPEEWNKRDYGKPRSDKKSGMLPPKLARMLINIALGQGSEEKGVRSGVLKTPYALRPTPNCLVVDPFCGSGNVLLETMMLGCDVLGSDISEKAVEDSKENIEWLRNQYQVEDIKYQVFNADATNVDFSKILKTNSYELSSNNGFAIVAEPYLGEPKKFKSSWNATAGEYRDVKKLYLDFLKNLQLTTYNSQLTLSLVFPLVETEDRGQFSLFGECVDEIKKMGYTLVREPLIYGRDYQVVKRQIVLLELKLS